MLGFWAFFWYNGGILFVFMAGLPQVAEYVQEVQAKPREFSHEQVIEKFNEFRSGIDEADLSEQEKQKFKVSLDRIQDRLLKNLQGLKENWKINHDLVLKSSHKWRRHLDFSLDKTKTTHDFQKYFEWADKRTDPDGTNPDNLKEKNPIDDYPEVGPENKYNTTRMKFMGYLTGLKEADTLEGKPTGKGKADLAYQVALYRSKQHVDTGVSDDDIDGEKGLNVGQYIKFLKDNGVQVEKLKSLPLGLISSYLRIADDLRKDSKISQEELTAYQKSLLKIINDSLQDDSLTYEAQYDPTARLGTFELLQKAGEYQMYFLKKAGLKNPISLVKEKQEQERKSAEAQAKFTELKGAHEAMKAKGYVLDYKPWEGEPTVDTYFSYPAEDFDSSDLETLGALEPAMKKALSAALLVKKGDDAKGLKKKLVDVSARWALLQTKDNEKGATKKAKVDEMRAAVDSAESRLNVVDPKVTSTWKELLDGADHLKGVDQTLTEQDAAITALNAELDSVGTGGTVIAPGGTTPEVVQPAPGQVITLPPVPGTVDATGGVVTPAPGQTPGETPAPLPGSAGGVTQSINTVNGGTPPVAPVAGAQTEGGTPAKGAEVSSGDDPYAQNWSSGKEGEPLFTQPEVKTTSELVMRNDEGKLTEVKVPADTQVFLLMGVKPKEVEGRKFVKVRHGGQSGWIEGAGLVAVKADAVADYVPPKASDESKKTDQKDEKKIDESDGKESKRPKLSAEEKAAVELTAEQVEFQQFLRSKNLKEIFDQPSGKYFYRLGEVTKEKFFQESPVRKSGNPDVDHLYLREVAYRLAGEGISADRLKEAERVYLQAVEVSVVTFTSKPNLRELKNAYDRQFIEVWRKVAQTGRVEGTSVTFPGSGGTQTPDQTPDRSREAGREKDPYASFKPFYPDYAEAMEKIIRDGDSVLGAEFDLPINGQTMKCRVRKYEGKYVFSYGEQLKMEVKFDSLKDCLRNLNSGLLKAQIMHEFYQNKKNYVAYEADVGKLDVAGYANRKNDQLVVEFAWKGVFDPKIYVDVVAHGRARWRIEYNNSGLQGEKVRTGFAEDYDTFMRQMAHMKKWAEGTEHGKEQTTEWKREVLWEGLSDSMNFRTLDKEKKMGMVKGFRVLPDETVEVWLKRGSGANSEKVVRMQVTADAKLKVLNDGSVYETFEGMQDGIAKMDFSVPDKGDVTLVPGSEDKKDTDEKKPAASEDQKTVVVPDDAPKPANEAEAVAIKRIQDMVSSDKPAEWKKSSRQPTEGKTRYYQDLTYEFNGIYTLPEGQKEVVLGTKEIVGVKKVQIVAQRAGDGGTKIYAIKEE